ncbi:nucleotidyl transferase AbiEii/AbiGii toxin family protein [Pseudothermotoga elfii]|uniref:nucleotidyl transferase AbiEii/AbiGii toxin family protein n=1 Tax=Pseudothermotoga elfii TaxID=38322 RepID=UPI00048EC30E|nr:nucleotidyl transferase AbiEii/AbiGii toxin family protein [Pseudothermotoga elfii]
MKKLREDQMKVLEKLLQLGIFHDFYLAGGTSLCLKYNHRPSLDFDFFLFPEKNFSNIYENEIYKHFNIEFIYKDNQTLIFQLDGIKVSLFEYPYPLLEEPDKITDLYLAHDKDIACMKMSAIAQRGLKKDFFDLWYLINIYRWGMKELLSMLERKYKDYNPLIFLKALVYFEDAEKNIDFEEVEEKWLSIKKFFTGYIKSF